VPRGILEFGEIEEHHRRPHTSQTAMESIAAELKEFVEEPPFTSSVPISEMEKEHESEVSTAAITSMGTYWDFVGFGTAEGGVGVHIGTTDISWRPHSEEVTGIAFCGGSSNLGILSTSLDGAVRRSDLARQCVLLEYQEETGGINSMVKRNQSEFVLGCDSGVRLLDQREKRVSSLLKTGGSRIALHPIDPHLLAVGAYIYDLRQPKNALLKLQRQVSSLQWSPISGDHMLAVTERVTERGYGTRYEANVLSMEQLLRGEEGLLYTTAATAGQCRQPLQAQWNPWSEDSFLLCRKTSLGVPLVTTVDLDGKEIGNLMLKSGTDGFLLCFHARYQSWLTPIPPLC
jgi:hypothetical protein